MHAVGCSLTFDGPERASSGPFAEAAGAAVWPRPLRATRFAVHDDGQRRRLVERVERLGAIEAAELLAPSGARAEAGSVVVLRPDDGGVALDEILAAGGVDPRSTLVIGRAILAALVALHAAHVWGGRIDSSTVRVGADGAVRLDARGFLGAPLFDAEGELAQRNDLAAAGEVLRRCGARLASGGVAELIDDGGLVRGGSAAAALARFDAVTGPLGDEAARRTLAARVHTLQERRRAAAGPPAQPGGADPSAPGGALLPPPAAQPPPWEQVPVPGGPVRSAAPAGAAGALSRAAGAAAGALWRAAGAAGRGLRRLRRFDPPVAAGAVVAVAALTALLVSLVVLGGGSVPQRSAGPAGEAATPAPTPASPAATPTPPAPPAPLQAGNVTAVAVSAVGDCAPGAACRLEVRVSLGHAAPQRVAWSFRIVDTCTRAVTEAPGASVDAAADWVYVLDQVTVALPAGGHPLAVYAVTSEPAVATSPPLSVAGGAPRC